MDLNMKVEKRLNQIVNIITKQGEARLNELSRYPICILYGQFSETVTQMIQMELVSKIGDEGAVEMIFAECGNSIKENVSNAVNSFRKKMGNGNLRLMDQYYVPVIFMADQLNAEEMKEMLSKVKEQMDQMGFRDKYQIWYYCVFNYEEMEGCKCKEQMDSLQEDSKFCFPMGIYTQNNLYVSEYQKYLKDVQSISMHIFLKISKADEADFSYPVKEQKTRRLVMGYWKMDVLKQKVAERLISVIKQQEKNLIGKADYTVQIREIIERIVIFNADEWVDIFAHVPINYTAAKDLIRRKRLGIPTLTYGDVINLLYGAQDIFFAFVRSNTKEETGSRLLESFFRSDIGNLYAVSHELEGILVNIKKNYQDEMGQMLTKKRSYNDNFRYERKSAISDILSRLRVLWKEEAEILTIEYKINFIDSLINYMKTPDFQNQVNQIKERNRNEINQLALVRTEASLTAGSMPNEGNIQILMPEGEQMPIWNEDIFDDGSIEKILVDTVKVRSQVQEWLEHNMDKVLGGFVAGLHALKMNNYQERYYSAKMNTFNVDKEKECLYMGRCVRQYLTTEEGTQRIVELRMPKVKVIERDWEADTCFELFAIQEIESFDVIYNMDKNGEGGFYG